MIVFVLFLGLFIFVLGAIARLEKLEDKIRDIQAKLQNSDGD